MLMLCAFIWGTRRSTVAQSAGSGMGLFILLAGRSWLAVLVLPTVRASLMPSTRQHGAACQTAKAPADRRLLLTAGLLAPAFCGLRCPTDRHHAPTLHGQGRFLTAMYVGAGVRAVLGGGASARLWLVWSSPWAGSICSA